MKKIGRLTLATMLAGLIGSEAIAVDMVIVDENFDSYTTQGELDAVWRPDAGDGISPVGGPNGELIPTTNTTKFPSPNDMPAGIQGNAAGSTGGINELVGSYSLAPSETQNVVVRGDIYTFTDGSTSTDETTGEITSTNNTRMSIGLRNDTIDRDPNTFGFQAGLNLFEMGFYNNTTCDPTVAGCDTSQLAERPIDSPGYRQTSQFGVRIVLFQFGSYDNWSVNGAPAAPLEAASPNYQYFDLDPALDLAVNGGNEDGVVNIADIGADWHTYEATFSETGLEVTLDLRRDGINNATGLPGVDASISLDVLLGEDPSNPGVVGEFTSLRFGGQSGIASQTEAGDPQPGIFDNIYLALEDADSGPTLLADFNGDGNVDLLDLDILGQNFGTMGTGTMATGDANGDGDVDLLDLDILGQEFGSGSGSAVPEPTAAALLAASCGLLAVRRR